MTQKTTTTMSVAELLAAKAKEKYQKVNENRDLLKELKEERFEKDTSIYAVVTNRNGYYGFYGATPQDVGDMSVSVSKAEFKGAPMSTQQSAIAGVAFATKDAMDKHADRKKVVMYVQDSEVKRLGGFINCAKANSNQFLTDGQVQWIDAHRGYGQTYVEVAARAYQMIRLALQNGYVLQFQSLKNLDNFELSQNINPQGLAGKKVTFKNSMANINGKTLVLKEKNIYGEYELVDDNGRLAVKRNLNKEQEIALGLKGLVDSSLKERDTEARLGNDTASESSAA